MKTALVIFTALVLLAGVAFWVIDFFSDSGGIGLSGHGIAALILGVVLTAAVGVGLMALVFQGARSGRDDQVHWPDDRNDWFGQEGDESGTTD